MRPITIILACGLAILCAAVAQAADIECPRTEGECTIQVRAPESPSVTHICTTDVITDACVEASPGGEVEITRGIPTGAGDQRIVAYACRADRGLCSEMSADAAVLLDLGRPTIRGVIAKLGDAAALISGAISDLARME